MTRPIVYDVLIRREVPARNQKEALQEIGKALTSGATRDLYAAFEVIRDDNAFPPKDDFSRQHNGFAVFTAEQKHQLVAKLKDALDAAGKGDPAPGEQLLRALTVQLDYLGNNTLLGVEV